jgi:probable rRNA maturation factor
MSSRKSLARPSRRLRPNLERLAARFLRTLKIKNARADIFLLSDRKMAALKMRFIKKKTEPNVLAFPEPRTFPHPEFLKERYLGEIYLNEDILRKSPERAAPLLLHGLLHLLGYDHKKNAEAKKMEKLERQILNKKI